VTADVIVDVVYLVLFRTGAITGRAVERGEGGTVLAVIVPVSRRADIVVSGGEVVFVAECSTAGCRLKICTEVSAAIRKMRRHATHIAALLPGKGITY
jgi:hypothetical protein